MNDETVTVVRPRDAPPARPGAVRAVLEPLIAFAGPWVRWLRDALTPIAAGASRARRLVAPVTTAGWLIIVAAVTCVVVAWVTRWIELVVIAVVLAAGVLVAAAYVAGGGSYTVHIGMSPRRVTAGDRAFGTLVIRARGRGSRGSGRIEVPIGSEVTDFSVPPLTESASVEELFIVPTYRRAVIVAGPPSTVRGDPVGVFRRRVPAGEATELFVHPRRLELTPQEAGLIHDLDGALTRRLSASDMTLHTLRPYVPGDDRRHVHWKLTARTGQLMVRQYEETRRSLMTVLLGSDPAYYADDDEFELAVSIMATIATRVIRSRQDIAVVSDALVLGTRTTTRLLDDSARLVFGRGPHSSPLEFARDALRRLPPPTVAVLIGGSRWTLSDLRSMCTVLPSDARVLAFLADGHGSAQVSHPPGMTVVRLSALEELRGLLVGVRG